MVSFSVVVFISIGIVLFVFEYLNIFLSSTIITAQKTRFSAGVVILVII